MTRIHVERTIAAAPEQVFDWLADPANLTAARLMLKAGWAPGTSGPAVGAVRRATAAGMSFREEITAYDPPRSYSYQIVRVFPPLDHQGGTMTLTPSGTGTHVDWVTAYTHPVWIGGKLTEAVTSRLLGHGFRQILAGCARELEG